MSATASSSPAKAIIRSISRTAPPQQTQSPSRRRQPHCSPSILWPISLPQPPAAQTTSASSRRHERLQHHRAALRAQLRANYRLRRWPRRIRRGGGAGRRRAATGRQAYTAPEHSTAASTISTPPTTSTPPSLPSAATAPPTRSPSARATPSDTAVSPTTSRFRGTARTPSRTITSPACIIPRTDPLPRHAAQYKPLLLPRRPGILDPPTNTIRS